MSNLVQMLTQACEELGLQITFGFVLMLTNGSRVVAYAHIPSLGASRGMLIFRSYDEIQLFAEEVVRSGYGYSVLDEPRPDEDFDLESFKEMFSDWGWTGEGSSKPFWMK